MLTTGTIRAGGLTVVAVGAIHWLLELLDATTNASEWLCPPTPDGSGCPRWVSALMRWPLWITPAILLFGFALLWIARRRERPPGPVANFYATRRVLNAERRGIWLEMEQCRVAWAVWPSGTAIAGNEDRVSLMKLRRVILTNPEQNNPLFPAYCERIANRDPAWVRRTIHQATRLAQQATCEVRWHNDVPISFVIFDPAGNGEVRFELLLPLGEAGDRPSVLVPANQYPEVVHAMRETFEAMWRASVPAPDLRALAEA